MRTTLLTAIALATTVATTATASAGGQTGSLGVGVESTLAGLTGASLNFDGGRFHLGGMVGFKDPSGASNTTIATAARFFLHVHDAGSSDFGLGLQIGYQRVPVPGGEAADQLYLEPAFQIRAFLTPNVALSATGGIVLGLVDADGVSIGGQVTGGAGLHHYFH